MLRSWTVNSYYAAHLIAHEEIHRKAIADAALRALLANAEKPDATRGTRLRRTFGMVLIRIGQRLQGTVVYSTDIIPAASR